jgi:hypothetical protein
MTALTSTSATDISDWPGSPPATQHHGAATTGPIRVEQRPAESGYEVRLELPLAADADVRYVTTACRGGVLTVRIGLDSGRLRDHYKEADPGQGAAAPHSRSGCGDLVRGTVISSGRCDLAR